jgi:hypothetical protein
MGIAGKVPGHAQGEALEWRKRPLLQMNTDERRWEKTMGLPKLDLK